MMHSLTHSLQSLPETIIYDHLARSRRFIVRRRNEQCVLYFLNEPHFV